MHGVRRCDAQLGDTACVIGLGLVGQLVVQLLVAAGVRVVGLDMVEDRCKMAERAGAMGCASPEPRESSTSRSFFPMRQWTASAQITF
jgi:threonine dehydrogenase-like Zn-dependent dehydrogenase